MQATFILEDFPITREFGDGEQELLLTVEVAVYPGSPGRMYMPNGDPGYPPEPSELEVLSALDPLTSKDWRDDLTEADIDRLWDEVNEALADGPD